MILTGSGIIIVLMMHRLGDRWNPTITRSYCQVIKILRYRIGTILLNSLQFDNSVGIVRNRNGIDRYWPIPTDSGWVRPIPVLNHWFCLGLGGFQYESANSYQNLPILQTMHNKIPVERDFFTFHFYLWNAFLLVRWSIFIWTFNLLYPLWLFIFIFFTYILWPRIEIW